MFLCARSNVTRLTWRQFLLACFTVLIPYQFNPRVHIVVTDFTAFDV